MNFSIKADLNLQTIVLIFIIIGVFINNHTLSAYHLIVLYILAVMLRMFQFIDE